MVLDKPGKPSYNSPSCFRVILLLRTLSKILESVVASCLSAQAAICSLIHPLECRSLPRRSTADAALVLQDNVESLHRLRYKVSTLFLDVKVGFDNVESPSLLSLLDRTGVSPYLVVTGAHYREVNSKVATAPKLKVEDKDRVNNSRRIKTVKLNIVKLKASLNKFS